jgi:exonuclease III
LNHKVTANFRYLNNRTEWKELPAEKVINQVSSPYKFGILSWNVWIFEENREERIKALIDKIRNKPPDFILFVENTPQSQHVIEQQAFIRENYFTSVVTPQTQQSTYKVSIMSRFPISSLNLYDLPWSTRRAIVADFHFKTESKEFSFSLIGTALCYLNKLKGVHLVSEYYQTNQRAEQLAFLQSKLDPQQPHFILGDLNLHVKAEDESFEKLEYTDTWKQLEGMLPLYTSE